MDIKLIAQVACSILALLATHGTCQDVPAGDCQFRFHQQPGSDLSCNPHQGTTTLHLTCFAGGPLWSRIQISWWSSKLPIHNSTSQPPPLRLNSPVTETRANNSQSTLVSSTLSLRVQEDSSGGGAEGVCIWCEIEAPGRPLISPASSRLCVSDQQGAYTGLRACESQEVVSHSFNRVCIEEQSAVVPQPTVYDTVPLNTHSVRDSRGSCVQHGTTMPTGSMFIHVLDPESAYPSKTPAAIPNIYPLTDMPTANIDFGGGERSGMTPPVHQGPFATAGLYPELFPTPTRIGDVDKEREQQHPGSLLSGESLMALYTAVVVCVLLAAVVVVLITIVLIMCRRHRQLQRRRSSSAAKPHGSRSRLGSNRAGHYRSQLSFSGSETVEMRRDLGGGGGEGVPIIGAQDTRYGSEQEARKGSLDTRSSIGSRSASTEKSNSLPRKNSLHKYAEIDTVEMSQSAPHHNGGSGFLHQQHISSRNGGISSKVIPPPPNTRARSSSTPHFYYILEKMDCVEEKGGKDESRIKSPWEVGAPSQMKPRSREGSGKNRAGSLKGEVDGATRTEPSVGNKSSDLCWGDGTMRSRSGSCPSREKKRGSTKRLVVSREGSSKSTKSRSGSGKRAMSVERNGKVVTAGSREGSVKSRGSRDGSCKKEVWVPAPDLLQSNDDKTSDKRVPPPYDALEPKFGSYPSPYSIINESYFAGCDDARSVLFDDPKYAAVSVGDLPQLVNQHRHQSLDPIIPRGSHSHQVAQCGGRVQQAGRRGGGGGVGRVKAASSKSLQDSGVLTGGGGGGARESIYETRESTPMRGVGMSVGGHAPSRLSMPFDSYYS